MQTSIQSDSLAEPEEEVEVTDQLARVSRLSMKQGEPAQDRATHESDAALPWPERRSCGL